MDGKRRTIELDEDVAVALERRAAERSIGVSDVMADLLAGDELAELYAERSAGQGHWSPAEIAADTATLDAFRRDRIGVPWEDAKAWIESWGAAEALPVPKIRKL